MGRGAPPGLTVPRTTRWSRALGALAVAAALLTACSSPTPPAPRPTPAATVPAADPAAQSVVDTLVQAGRTGDRAAFDAATSTVDPTFADRARLLYGNLVGLPWAVLDVRLRADREPVRGRLRELLGPDAWQQPATVRWRLVGETATAEHTVWLTFDLDGDRPQLAGTTPPEDPDDPDGAVRPQPVWWTGPVSAASRDGVTVLAGPGQSADAWLDRAVAAAAVVRERVRAGDAARWGGGLVVEVPASRTAFEAELGADPGSYTGIAAVTLGEGSGAGSALRVVVNPDVTRVLAPLGVAVVLTHETVHVATRSPDSPAPTWLVEGLADEVALAANPAAADGVAEPLLARVRADGAPEALPGDEAFLAGADDLAVSYAAAWTACRYVAETWSEEDLQRLYTAVDGGQRLDAALQATLGTDEARFTAGWRAALARQARS
ncbi:hypothetical protein SAMN04488543_0998 [Friedmanniella luteola]|uniref:Peptidase MA superfamily protein n=1 Tax=Friedmanniella luteola TaxID=546871 RepID=A0A1H1P5L5_9ACTN|nr:hypothetical protein [Friedmanniella luteola]SDS06531.1 hypothetical protein SAMN04488543_0998 [Friedmanniella luteola]